MIVKLIYDEEIDALSIVFRDTTVTTKQLAEGIAADYDSQGRLAGLEILDAVRRFGDRDTLQEVVLDGFDSTAHAAVDHLVVAEAKEPYTVKKRRGRSAR
jgi:uncharacterized protein YuzE